jgi:hypothetical protein
MISPSAQAGKFVISLCSVAVPITIPQPRSPELLRYRFFLHTSWEEGTRMHRLYMGYFATREYAVKWLGTLRRIYPSAFVSFAPEVEALSNSQIVSLLDQPASVSSQPVSASPQRAPAPSVRRADTQPRTADTQSRERLEKRRSEPSLEDTIAALKVNTLAFDNDEDSLSATGVRHLRIEVQSEPRARTDKRSGSRKS